MSKRSAKKSKRRSKALPALGVTGLSLSLASGATASTGETTTVGSITQPHEIFLGEEEVFDTSLSTFFTFDKENGEQTSHAQDLKLAKGGGGCGCGGGCGGKGGGGGEGGGCGCGCGGGGGGGGYKGGCGGGAMGVKGPTGAMGVKGPTGAMGVKGPTGAMGVKGWGCKGFQHHCRCAFFRRCFGCGC